MTMKKMLVGAVVGVGLMGMSAGAALAGGDHHCGGKHRGAAYMKHDAGARMFRGLELSDAQREQLREIGQAKKAAMGEHRQALRETRRALREAVRSEELEADKVRELADAHASAMADVMVARAEAFHEMRSVLTPDQRQSLAERKQRHRKGRSGGAGE